MFKQHHFFLHAETFDFVLRIIYSDLKKATQKTPEVERGTPEKRQHFVTRLEIKFKYTFL